MIRWRRIVHHLTCRVCYRRRGLDLGAILSRVVIEDAEFGESS